MIVRAADVTDLESALLIAERRRHYYARFQPQFWNPAPDALGKQPYFFELLLTDPQTLFAVAATADGVQGFVIARVTPPPPVYDPGGATCLVDDFTVDDSESWPEVGPRLLAFVRSWAMNAAPHS